MVLPCKVDLLRMFYYRQVVLDILGWDIDVCGEEATLPRFTFNKRA